MPPIRKERCPTTSHSKRCPHDHLGEEPSSTLQPESSWRCPSNLMHEDPDESAHLLHSIQKICIFARIDFFGEPADRVKITRLDEQGVSKPLAHP